jgi:hypothetical protein
MSGRPVRRGEPREGSDDQGLGADVKCRLDDRGEGGVVNDRPLLSRGYTSAAAAACLGTATMTAISEMTIIVKTKARPAAVPTRHA